MNKKYDRLADELDARLRAAPPRGQGAEAPRTSRAPRSPAATDPVVAGRTTRGRTEVPAGLQTTASGLVRRGHLVPDELHRRARRAKVTRSAGERITWTDVMIGGIEQLLDGDDVVAVAVTSPPTGRRRLVQVMLPVDLDRRLAELLLDLNDRSDRRITYEALWAAALERWIDG